MEQVTPRVGVWIETTEFFILSMIVIVTPRVGVWIETCALRWESMFKKSLPAWECGLKLFEAEN